MKRRSFILTACAAAITIPIINYSWLQTDQHDPLSYPVDLGKFCNEDSICGIGKKYRNLNPKENLKEELTGLLMSDISDNRINLSDKSRLKDFLNKKIHEDFSDYRTIVINGWVISITEARQCALYSINSTK